MGILCDAELLESSPHLALKNVHRNGERHDLIEGVIGPVVTERFLILIIKLGGGCPKASLSSFLYFLESIDIPFSLLIPLRVSISVVLHPRRNRSC